MSTRLLAPGRRCVLFAEGYIKRLDQTQFEEAMEKDEARRRKLGLPARDGVSQSQP